MKKQSHGAAMTKTQVFERKDIPKAALMSRICAWRGCTATCKGDLPRGWVFLIAYWSKKPFTNFMDIPPKDIYRDAVLCPEHARELESHLKDLG